MAPGMALLLCLFMLQACATLGQLQVHCYDRGTFARAAYPYCKELSSELALHWRVEDGYITYGIAAASKYNMIGLGLSDSGGMRGADMAVLTKEEAGTGGMVWVVRDYWSTDFVKPTQDTKQDYSLLSYSWGATVITVAEVQRALDTGDAQDMKIYTDTDQLVVWALGDQFEYHGPNRGWQVLRLNPANYNTTWSNIIDGGNSSVGNSSSSFNFGNNTEYTYRMALIAQDPPDLATLNISLPAAPVSAMPGTSYQCMAAPLPTGKKFHIIRYRGFNQSSVTPSLVSNMRLYGCTSPPAQFTPYDCMGVPDSACNIPLGFWGKGMLASMVMPPEAGLPMGQGAGLAMYAMLVVEYRNTAGTPGVRDSSGFTLSYTAALRPYDMGVLRLGSRPPPLHATSIGPSLTGVGSLQDWCPSSCTGRLPYGVTLVANYLLMDAKGQAIVTRHITDGSVDTGTGSATPRVEIQPLGSKSYWWMGWQSFKQVLPRSRSLTPGDTFATFCNTTAGPVGTCLNYLHYYPAVPGWTDCGLLPGPQPTQTLQPLQRNLSLATCTIKRMYNLNLTGYTMPLSAEVSALAVVMQGAYNASLPPSVAALMSPADMQRLSVLSAQGLAQLGNISTLLDSLSAKLITLSNAAVMDNGTISSAQISSMNDLTQQLPSLNAATHDWVAAALLRLNSSLNSTAPAVPVSLASVLPGLLQLGAGSLNSTTTAGSVNGLLNSGNVSALAEYAKAGVGAMTVQDFASRVQADPLMQELPVSVVTASDMTYTAYVEPYEGPEPYDPPYYATGQAVASIIVVVIGCGIVQAFLWFNYARKEDPERQALLAALQQTILEEAVLHPDLTEEELRNKLYDQVRRRLQADGTIAT